MGANASMRIGEAYCRLRTLRLRVIQGGQRGPNSDTRVVRVSPPIPSPLPPSLPSHPLTPHPRDLSHLRAANDALLPDLEPTQRDRHLAEVYVQAEVEWLRSQPTVAKAIAERGLLVHAFVFDKEKEACVRLVEEGGEQGGVEAAAANGGPNGVVA